MKKVKRTQLLFIPTFLLSLLLSGASAETPEEWDGILQKKADFVWFDSNFQNLSQMTDRFAEHLSKEVTGRKVYLDRTTIRDMLSGCVINFSTYLQNELESSLSRKGFSIVYEPDKAYY